MIYFSGPLEIIQILSQANPFFILLGVFIWFFDSLLRTLRWQILLKKINISIPFLDAWQIMIASMFISNLSPAKTGDPVRSLILKKTNKKSFSKSLPSIIIERISDIIILIIICFIGLLFVSSTIPQISYWFYLSLFVYAGIFLSFLYFITNPKKMETFLSKILSLFSFIPQTKKYAKKINYFSNILSSTFSKYKSLPTITYSFILTSFIWMAQSFILLISFYSLGISVPLWYCLLAISLSVLIGILTFLPGTIGSSEFITVLFFTSFLSLAPSQITSAVIIQRLLSFGIYVSLGAIIFSYKFK
ncbi:MAG: flippase-like domain-containing protein [Candidatus Aenigmarchaeota archaeon]|nr:flippase-like domain-containing protein [Candidatus Aenigmarchaeota archaeon]